jgi:hypothetical protein
VAAAERCVALAERSSLTALCSTCAALLWTFSSISAGIDFAFRLEPILELVA